MATNFDSVFGTDYLNSLAPSQDVNVMQNLAGPTDLTAQIQPQPVAQPATPQPQVSAAPNAMQAAQPAPVQPYLGQPQTLQPTAPPLRQRSSLLEHLGMIGDKLNMAFGDKTMADRMQTNAAVHQSDDLNNQAKAQDIAQTGVATQQNANQLINGFAQGLQKIRDTGGNLDVAAPALAQQLGIPAPQAAAILANYKNNPQTLDALAEATATPGKGGATGRQLALAYTPAHNNLTGKDELLQAGADGGLHPVANYSPIGTTKMVDAGTHVDVTDGHSGSTIRTIQKDGAPIAGTVANGTDANGRPIYAALPGGKAALDNEKTQTEIDKNKAAAAATQAKAAAALSSQQAAYDGIDANLKKLESNIGKLKAAGALTGSAGQNAVGSVVNAFQASALGKKIGLATGDPNANIRSENDSIKALLLPQFAKGQGQLFRNKTEQQTFMNGINNPGAGYAAQLQSIRNLRASLGGRPGGPAAPAPRTAAPTIRYNAQGNRIP